MANAKLNIFLRRLTRAMTAETLSNLSDQQLVEQLLRGPDEAAFEVVVRRHGPMVYRVCWRVLGQEQDAEDAFQATFLLLSQKLGFVRNYSSLASWLHGVAHRVALKARAKSTTRQKYEKRSAARQTAAADDVTWGELRTYLDAELGKLQDKWRLPLILCYLEGRTQDEAAVALGWSKKTLRRRLEEGRTALGRRLGRRGVVGPAALGAILVADCFAAAAVPSKLLDSTIKAASCMTAGQALSAGVSAKLAALTKGVLKAMLMSKTNFVAVMLLAVVALGGAFTLYTYQVQGQDRQSAQHTEAAEPLPTTTVDSHGDPLPHGARARLGSMRLRATGDLQAIAYSPDGKLVATGGYEAAIRLWDAGTGKPVRVLDGWVTDALFFSKDGSTLIASNESSPTAHRWNVATGRELPAQEWQNAGQFCASAAISPDGKIIASGSSDGTICLRDSATGRLITRLQWHKSAVRGVAFSPDGTHLASCSDKKGPILVGRIDGKAAPRQFKGDRTDYQWNSVCFSPDGKQLVAGGDRFGFVKDSVYETLGTIHCWDVESGKVVRDLLTKKVTQRAVSVAYSPDGKVIASGFSDRSVRLWEAASGKLILTRDETRETLGYMGRGLAFAPDSKTLAVVKGHGVDLVHVATGKSQIPQDGHDDWIVSLAFSGSGNVLVSASGSGGVRLWDTRSGRLLQRFPDAISSRPVAISPDGKVIASGSGLDNPNSMVSLWDVATGRLLGELGEGKPLTTRISSLAFSADGKLLAYGSEGDGDGRQPASIPVWEVATGKRIREFKGLEIDPQMGRVEAVSFSANLREVMAGTSGPPAQIRRWELSTGKRLVEPLLPREFLNNLVFSPDGTFTAFSQLNGQQIYFQPLAQAGEARILDVTGADRFALSQDGRFLATGAWENAVEPKAHAQAVRVWELASGQEIGHFNPGAGVTAVAFSGDGKTLATGHTNTTVLLWNLLPTSGKPRTPADLWADLADKDAGRAHRAVADLVSMPPEAVTLMKEHLRPVQPADPEVTAKLIADLGSEEFNLREQASKALENLEERAREAMSKALQGDLDLEVKVRLEKLLKRLSLPTSSTRLLRDLRAVLVLEKIGSADARQILRALSEGDPKALLTREAVDALRRSGKNPTGKHRD